MKKNIITLFLALASVINLHAAITYELNGGVTNDYGWMSKSDMFQACMEDAYGYDIGISLNEFKQDNNPYIYLLFTLEFNVSRCQNILDNSRWDWLEDYLVMIQEESVAATLTKGHATADWRYAIAAFFFEGQYSTSSDYSQFGKYEEYILAWKHGFDNPTEPTSDWVLNAPYKEGYSFAGWYATPDFSGNKVTTINASTTGTLYAKWELLPVEPCVTSAEERAIFFKGDQDWGTSASVYMWNNTGCIAAWPGQSAEHLGGGIFKYVIPEGIDVSGSDWQIIWNNNGKQTGDLKFQMRGLYSTAGYQSLVTKICGGGDTGETPIDPTLEPTVVMELVGVVKRAVQLGESAIVLTHETDGTPHIYEIAEGTILELLQNGVIAVDPENAGDYLAISDIAVTEDGKLIATNYMQTQSGDDYVDAGYKRGETRIYIWNDLHGAPSILFTSKMSSNWFRSKQGLTMAVKGTSDNMEIFMTGIHATKAWARASSYRVIDGVYTEPDVNHNDHYFFYDINDAIALETTVGTQYELNASPLGDMNWVLDAELINPTEITEPEANWVEIATSVALTEDLGKKYNGASYLNVAGQALMVAPFANPDGELVGIEILNITNGFDAPQYINMLYLDEAVAAQAAATAVTIVDNTLAIALVVDANLYMFDYELPASPTITTEETITTCDSYQWNGQTYTQSGDYTYTTTATNGCDSTITLHLTINQTQYAEETITACDSYTWNGQTYTQSGDYTYSTTAINGCDSIATLHLLVYQSKHTEEHITACDNYEWNGQIYTESGTYTHTSTTIDGCDSIVTLHLTINYSEVGETENVTICYGETYTWNGQTYSTAGEYSIMLSNSNGCDSTATLHLTIMPQAQEEVQYETINKKETPFIWQKNGKKYYETTTDSIFIPYTHYDCDSMIYILDLTIVDVEDVRAEYDTICESALPYEWHGQSITTGGRYEYTEKYGDTNIDILNVLYLTVIPTIRTQQSATICYEETFAWNGNTYSQTGTYTYTTEAANGCDSVVTLYLTVLPPAITIYTDTMIAHVDLPYIWRGQYCDTSGEYTATIPFAANTACDSVIYVLNLTVESVNKCGADLSWEYDNGILTISGSGAMYDNPDLQSYRHESWYPYRVRQVILSDQLTHIGNVAFADCANLTNIDIPSSVTSIGDGAFSWTGLLFVTIPATVTELGEQVFETCNNLHTILYEGTPSSISNQTVHPFIGCVHLDTIITPAELWHCTSADPVLENRYGVPHKARYIEVTDGFLTNQAMKYIAKNASTLKVLDLTYATNTTLPYGALSDSYQLTTLYLPQQIEVIPESMIEGGRNLTEILIPATVTEIGNNAFAGCTNVWRMTVEAVLPPKAYDKTFDGIDRSISLIVPAGSEDLYRQAEYWREFFIEHTNSPSPISNCQKILREDHILILREGKVYTTMGQLINVGE